MSNERVKPTAEQRCTSDCPSFNSKTCLVCGEFKVSIEADPSGFGGDRCTPAVDAIQDAYQASRKKATRQEYMTIRGHEDTFDDKVNASMADGWQLHGPTSSTWDECRFLYSQAMVRDVPASQTVDIEAPAGWMTDDPLLAKHLNERIGAAVVPVKVGTVSEEDMPEGSFILDRRPTDPQ